MCNFITEFGVIGFERDNLFESFVVVSLFPIDSEYESVMPQTQLEKEKQQQTQLEKDFF
jgi:hypothetical protein